MFDRQEMAVSGVMNRTGGVQPARAESAAAREGREAIARIKEVGFRTYVEELNEKKIEELREKILQAMGYSKADLAKMPANQRAMIEKLVDEEVKRQLAANSLMQNGEDDRGGAQSGIAGMEKTARMASGANVGQRLGLELLEAGNRLIGQEGDPGLQDGRRHHRQKDGLFD